MENIGFIEIRITGSKGNLELSPDNYDIRELIAMLENVENLLYPNEKKERPTISYRVEDGSVKHILKTSMQYIIGFNAVIAQVNENRSIDFLAFKTAKAFENIQDVATKKDYTFSIKTSLEQTNEITVDKTTSFYRSDAIWADAEFYFYGKITNAGGKDKPNIHLVTEDLGTIIVQTTQDYLEKYNENMLYKTFGIRAKGKQHSETGEIDKTTLKFIEMAEYQPKYDEQYLNQLIEKASKSWDGIKDKEAWLREVRGGYHA